MYLALSLQVFQLEINLCHVACFALEFKLTKQVISACIIVSEIGPLCNCVPYDIKNFKYYKSLHYSAR